MSFSRSGTKRYVAWRLLPDTELLVSRRRRPHRWRWGKGLTVRHLSWRGASQLLSHLAIGLTIGLLLLLLLLLLWHLTVHTRHFQLMLFLLLLFALHATLSPVVFSLLDLVDLTPIVQSISKAFSVTGRFNSYLCSFISFHSLKAPLIPKAAMPTAAASWTQAFVWIFRASCGDISPSATSLCLFSWASMLE